MYGKVIACPFCGKIEPVHLKFEHEKFRMWCDDRLQEETPMKGCGGQSGMHKTAVEAVAAWNTRSVIGGEINFNINHTVWVKLTPMGRKHHRSVMEPYCKVKGDYSPPREIDGWSEWQLHALMNIFDELLWVGSDVPFEPTIKFSIGSINYEE